MGKENKISGALIAGMLLKRADESNDGSDTDLEYADVASKRYLKMPINIAALRYLS
ncbi:hypothetical protein RYH73_25895 [Olivibacter sp. CPCC 100613]|uniref:hypothetical protein n=1 Tax=Olivibacter sp. CPCC 100613 TaxID=3079931 RepID=UPI002FF60DC7